MGPGGGTVAERVRDLDGEDWPTNAVRLTGIATAVLLVVLFYYPVGTVFSRALADGGTVFPILAEEFYLGAASTLFVDPVSVPAGLLEWVRAGFPPVHFGLVGFTAYQALLSALLSLALGLPGAYLLARYEFPGRRLVESLTMLPFVLPAILVAIGFVATFGEYGLLSDFLAFAGFQRRSALYTLEIIVLAHAFYNAPLVVRIVAAAWKRVDQRSVETARGLGASPLRAFWDVVVPQLRSAILTAGLFTFLFSFMSFPIVLALGGLQLATIEVWLYTHVQQLDLGVAAGLAVVETGVTLGLTVAYLRFETAGGRLGRGGRRRRLFESIDPQRVAVLAYGIVVAVVFVLPLASMIVESLTGPGGLTIDHYAFLLERQVSGAQFQVKPFPAVRNSLVFGAGTLFLAVPMGVVVAIIEGRYSRLLDAVLMGPIAVSGIVIGLGLLQGLVFGTELFGHRVTVTGPIAIVAAHAVAAYPFVTRTVSPLLKRVDDRLIESARVLGASRARVRLDVELPLVLPGIVAGAALAFAISAGEFDSTVILASGSGTYTMPVAVERYLGARTLGPATAMGTVLLAVTAGSFLVIDRFGAWWEP